MSEGWIKLHRKFLKWEWFDDINTCHLFLYISLKVNYEDKAWHGIIVKRGQLITSLKSLSRDTGLSIQNIRTSLDKLKSTGELTDQSTNRFRLLTIVKYEEYQSRDMEVTSQSTSKLTSNQQATNKQLTTTKEIKEIKEEKKESLSDFSKLELSEEMVLAVQESGLKEQEIEKAFLKFKNFNSKNPPKDLMKAWIGWCLNERVPKVEEVKLLTGNDLIIQRMGVANWKRTKGMNMDIAETKALQEYEKVNGVVNWNNLKEFNRKELP